MDTSHVIDGGAGITVWSFLFAWTAFFVGNVIEMDFSNVIDGDVGITVAVSVFGHFCLHLFICMDCAFFV